MKVLVVDGNNEVLELIRDMLAANHDVYVVRTLGEIQVDWSFDLVLADSFNPLCEFEDIDAYCKQKGFTLVAMSASSSRMHPRQLNKPFDLPDINRVVQLVATGLCEFVVDSIETRYLKADRPTG